MWIAVEAKSSKIRSYRDSGGIFIRNGLWTTVVTAPVLTPDQKREVKYDDVSENERTIQTGYCNDR
jgi:hypothetical protein